ncbi:unnamed protein product, partial [Sphacelaria rigidula]
WRLPLHALVSLAVMVTTLFGVDAAAKLTNDEKTQSTSRDNGNHRTASAALRSHRRRHHSEGANNRALTEEYTEGGSKAFSMKKVRTYTGPGFFESGVVSPSERFPQPGAEKVCERWAVILTTSTPQPTHTVQHLSRLEDWCVVVVAGDKSGSDYYGLETVTYLSPADQEAMPYRITSLLPWNHLGRKSIGYLYAIHHGAKVIFDVEDEMHVYTKDKGIPYADNGNVPHTSSSYTTASLAHNPYPCFGAPDKVWPRGFPPESADDPWANMCESVTDVSIEKQSNGKPRLLGVVQSLINNVPDVDAMCRLCDGDCKGTQFHFATPPPAAEGDGTPAGNNPLKIVPPSAFTPYNAQATLHFSVAFWGLLLPVTVDERVSDIWRSYFTQAFLPSTGAVTAFAYPWVEKVMNS